MLRIALMGDLHYPEIHRDEEDLAEGKKQFFDCYLKEYMGTDADWHISIGDLTHNGLAEEFRDVYRYVRESGVNFRQVLGNHDVLALRKEEIVSITEQPRYESIDVGPALILLLDTTKELDLYGWGLDAEQWDWLDRKLSEIEDKPVLIFAHHPVPGSTSESPSLNKESALFQDIRPLLEKRTGGGLFFNGHTHTHQIVTQGSWHFIQTGATLCDPCFRIIEIDSDEIRIITKRVQNPEILWGRTILYDQLIGFHRPEHFAYEDTDMNHTISNARNYRSSER